MKRKQQNVVAVWLEWPISSFQTSAGSLARLRELVPSGTRILHCRTEEAFLRALPSATHALVWNFEPAWFSNAPNLRVLATPAAGRELVPTVGPRGVTISFGAFHGVVISETVLALMLAHVRGLYRAYDYQRRGVLWPRSELSPFCSTLAGTRAVILGYGHIGRAIGDRLAAFGVSVTGIRRRNFAALDGALKTADWLIVALPSDTGTDDLVDARRLALLPPRAVLINIGRGNAVDEHALAAALKARRLAGAMLDVFHDEPLTAASPLAADLPGLVRLPHAAAFSPTYLNLFFEELSAKGLLK